MRIARITVTTTGSDGAASGTGYSSGPHSGEVVAVKVDWAATAPGTSDITITSEKAPTITYVSKSDSATDAWFYPRVQATDNGGSAISGEYLAYPVNDRLKVAVAQCNALDPAVTVYVFVREDGG